MPVHFRSSRPGPKGENFGVSRYPIGSMDGLVSEYEYLKSKGKFDFIGNFVWVFLFDVSSLSFLFFLFWGSKVLRIGEKGGSSSKWDFVS